LLAKHKAVDEVNKVVDQIVWHSRACSSRQSGEDNSYASSSIACDITRHYPSVDSQVFEVVFGRPELVAGVLPVFNLTWGLRGGSP
jgi:hypothetical protein